MQLLDNHTIEDVEIRGWDVHLYYPADLPFMSATVVGTDVSVFIGFEAEFAPGWEQMPRQKVLAAARKLAIQRTHDVISQRTRERRRKWRQRGP